MSDPISVRSGRLIIRQGDRVSTITTGDSKNVYRNLDSSEQAYTKPGSKSPRWRCSICGKALETPQQLLFNSCLEEKCQGEQERAARITRTEFQDRHVATRRPLLRSRGRRVTWPSMQVSDKLFTAGQEQAIEGRFWACYLPFTDQERSYTVLIARAQAPYQMLREIGGGSPLVKRCAQAVAFANLGRETGDRRLNMRGAQLYNGVLTQARDMVATHSISTQQRDDLLVCCLVMCTYELLRDDTELGTWYFNAYFSHVSGLCQVIRNVNKSREPSPSMQYAWREARLMAFRSAMFLRQPIFGLERPPEWSTSTPSLKLSDDVLDNMFELAKWFPTVDSLMKRMEQMQRTAIEPAAVERVVDRGLEIARELMDWEERAMDIYCNDRRPTLYSLCTTADGELLNVLTHHWMTCMLLHSQLQLLVARCSLWHPHLKLPFWIDGWPYAVFISVAGPLFSNPRFGIWSALASHTPMIATNFYFAANGHWQTPEARSLREFVEDESRPGNGLMRKFFYGLFARADVMIPQDGMVKAAQAWYGVRDSTPWKGAEESKK